MIYVVGHKNPDTDSICTAIATTAFLKARGMEAQPIRLGEISRETQYILDQAGAQLPELCEQLAGKKVWLVDSTDLSQAADDIDQAEIVGIIDHHRLGDVMTKTALEVYVLPIGCSSTVLFTLFNWYQLTSHITPQIAKLMLSAILSDTVAFRSPTCTPTDREAVEVLAEKAGVTDIDQFAQNILLAKTDIEGLSAAQLVEKDLKAYPFNGRDLVVGQVELATLDQVENMIEEINLDLQRRCQEEGLAFAAVMLTDITTITTRWLYQGEWQDKLASYEQNGMLVMENTLSRKKQGWPWLQECLAK